MLEVKEITRAAKAHDENQAPGYVPTEILDGKTRRPGAHILCPSGHKTKLTESHEITAGGVVSPGIQCAHEDCDFDDDITLVDWPYGESLKAEE